MKAAAIRPPANTNNRSPNWFQPSRSLILKLSDPKDRAASVVKAYFTATISAWRAIKGAGVPIGAHSTNSGGQDPHYLNES